MGLRQASALAIAIALLAAPLVQLRLLPRAGLLIGLAAVLNPLGQSVRAAPAAAMPDQQTAGRDGGCVILIANFAAVRRAPHHHERPLLLAGGRAVVSPGAVAFPAPPSPPHA